MTATRESILDRAETLRVCIALEQALEQIIKSLPPNGATEAQGKVNEVSELLQKMLARLEQDAAP